MKCVLPVPMPVPMPMLSFTNLTAPCTQTLSGPVVSFGAFFLFSLLFSGLLGDIQLRQAPALFAFRADSSITRQQQQQQLVSAAVLSQVLLFWCVAVDLWDQAVGLLPTVVVVVVVCLPHIFISALCLSGWLSVYLQFVQRLNSEREREKNRE